MLDLAAQMCQMYLFLIQIGRQKVMADYRLSNKQRLIFCVKLLQKKFFFLRPNPGHSVRLHDLNAQFGQKITPTQQGGFIFRILEPLRKRSFVYTAVPIDCTSFSGNFASREPQRLLPTRAWTTSRRTVFFRGTRRLFNKTALRRFIYTRKVEAPFPYFEIGRK